MQVVFYQEPRLIEDPALESWSDIVVEPGRKFIDDALVRYDDFALGAKNVRGLAWSLNCLFLFGGGDGRSVTRQDACDRRGSLIPSEGDESVNSF